MSKTASGLSPKTLAVRKVVASPVEKWEAEGRAIWQTVNRSAWALGDWWNAGEPYGERVEIAEHIGFDQRLCWNYGSIAGKFDPSRRREGLSFAHHTEVGALEPEDADAWLDKAQANGWSQKQLRSELRALPKAPTPELPAGTYATIVADPPWPYDEGWPEFADKAGDDHRRIALPYQSMTLDEIRELEVVDLIAPDAHLFLWTTNRYIREAYEVAEAWGFAPSQLLVWCKPPRGIGPGGIFSNTAEFVIYGHAGSPPYKQRIDSSWWEWPRGRHSQKPAPFLELIETVCDGPYLEMFSRAPRAGWEAWGLEA